MNETGITPVNFCVLVRVDEVDVMTTGGLFIPEVMLEREQMAHDRGTLIDKSDNAFNDWNGKHPEIGDKIIFKKFAGTIIQHRNDRKVIGKYRLCNDNEIFAIFKEGEDDGDRKD